MAAGKPRKQAIAIALNTAKPNRGTSKWPQALSTTALAVLDRIERGI